MAQQVLCGFSHCSEPHFWVSHKPPLLGPPKTWQWRGYSCMELHWCLAKPPTPEQGCKIRRKRRHCTADTSMFHLCFTQERFSSPVFLQTCQTNCLQYPLSVCWYNPRAFLQCHQQHSTTAQEFWYVSHKRGNFNSAGYATGNIYICTCLNEQRSDSSTCRSICGKNWSLWHL